MQKLSHKLKFFTYLMADILAFVVFGGILFANYSDSTDSSAQNSLDLKNASVNDGGVITSTKLPFGMDMTGKHGRDGKSPKVLLGTKNQGKGASVAGLLPPDVAILNIGGQYFTLRVGDKCPAGVLNEVSQEGVKLNDEFIKFKK